MAENLINEINASAEKNQMKQLNLNLYNDSTEAPVSLKQDKDTERYMDT